MKYRFNISSSFVGNIKSYDVELSARYEQTLQEFALSLLSTYLNSDECKYDASCVWCTYGIAGSGCALGSVDSTFEVDWTQPVVLYQQV